MTARQLSRFLTLLVLCLVLSARSSAEDEELSEEELAIKKWEEIFGRLKKVIGEGIKLAMPHLMSSMSDENLKISKECKRALFQWVSDLKTMKPWALKMGDASAKVIDGILTGTLSSFGSYDQCLDTVNPKGNIQGKYCSIESWPKMPPKPRFYSLNQRLQAFKKFENNTGIMGEFTKHVQLFYMFPLRIGICLPSPCSTLDVSNITALVSKNLFTVNVTVPRCEVKEPAVLENYQIPFLCVVAILVLLVSCGTLYDLLVLRKRNSKGSKDMSVLDECLLSFSAVGNWNKLMDLNVGSEDLRVLHGIRFFSMCWIILGHTYFHLNFNILRHLQVTIELTSQFIFNTVTNASLVVDNFFFISGLLYVYVTMDIMKVIGKMPRAAYFIVHRFWRFLPVQMFFIGCCTLLPLLGSGPTWHEIIDPIVEGCRKDWWANMIFINNLYRSTELGCLSYSWYLAADFQIYIFCVPIAILIIRKPRIGLWVNFAIMMLSVIAVAVHNYVRDLPPTLLFTRADIEQRNALMRETYYTPYQHLGPFCIGLFAGYYLKEYKSSIKMHWSLHVAAWVSTTIMMAAALFGVHPWNRGYAGTGVVASMLYASLSRMAWTLGIAWWTIACSTGCGGIFARILRSKIFIPFSRLTFLVYMVHPLVQHVFYGTLRDGIQALNHLAVFIWFGFTITSYGLALVLELLFESPIINLGKIVFYRREAHKKRKKAKATAIAENVSAVSPADWKNGPIPQLVNGYGKCNGAFDYHAEDRDKSKSTPVEKSGSESGDFICHL